MKKLLAVLFSLMALCSFASGDIGLSASAEKKKQALVADIFGKGYSLTYVTVDATLQRQLAKPAPDGSLCMVKRQGSVVGYFYVSRADGRAETFDYVAVFDANLTTLQVKVIDYRPTAGSSVASRFWLKQLAGKKLDYTFEYGRNVDALSGATISAMSLVEDINKVKRNISTLRHLGAL